MKTGRGGALRYDFFFFFFKQKSLSNTFLAICKILVHNRGRPCFSDVRIGNVFYSWPEMAKCFFIVFVIHIHFSVSWWSLDKSYRHDDIFSELARLASLLIQRSHDASPVVLILQSRTSSYGDSCSPCTQSKQRRRFSAWCNSGYFSGRNDHTGRLQFPSWKLNGKNTTGNQCCQRKAIYTPNWATWKSSAAGWKKLLGGRPYIGLLWRRLPQAKTPIFRGSALKFWQHWHKSWSNHYWQHGFSIRDVITDLFTNRQFFYHFNSTSSWQPKVRTLNTP